MSFRAKYDVFTCENNYVKFSDRTKNQSDCRICYRALLGKIEHVIFPGEEITIAMVTQSLKIEIS